MQSTKVKPRLWQYSSGIAMAGLMSLAEAQMKMPLFEDVTKAVGLDFVHFNGMTGKLYFPEMTGAGGALFDYDNDGDLDLYLVQGSLLGKNDRLSDMLFPPRATPPIDRLYRNDWIKNDQLSGKLSFVDVTEASGIRMAGYGMGVTVADYNNDGWSDLYITQYGTNHLLKNNGDGSFSDVTAQAGVGDRDWGTSAAFFDYDRDGWLDLYVVNYVDYAVDDPKSCYANNSRQDYCGPAGFTPQHDRLFHNLGNGAFEEVSDRLLKNYQPGAGLGVVTADFNADGWSDIYVANDGQANQFWINQGGRHFVEDALFSGIAVNLQGRAEASMGVTVGDYDRDGDPDLFMTHLMGESNTLYNNLGDGLFEDQTLQQGLSSRSVPYTAFGTGWIDYDNDGWLDLLALNGAVHTDESQALQGDPYPLHQPNQFFRNQQGKGFVEQVASSSPLLLSEVSRGAAFGDIDNDGDQDVVIFNNNGPARLLLNPLGQDRPWSGLILKGTSAKRHMLGAEVTLLAGEKSLLWLKSGTDGSYCSGNDPRLLFAYPDDPKSMKLRIRWPSGVSETHPLPISGRYATFYEPVGGQE